MPCRRVLARSLPAFAVFCFYYFIAIPAALGQVLENAKPQQPEQQHQHSGHDHAMPMDMNLPSGVTDKCEPKFTYDNGPLGPSHWPNVCTTGQMQSPIDITSTEKMAIPPMAPLLFSYQPADLDVVNACNNYMIKVRFPKNRWFKVARKPYRLSEIRFREPGETAVNGKRPAMSLEFVHLSPEATLLIIEVPVAVGKENPVIKTLWQNIPEKGKESKPEGIKFNPMDLLPSDHGYYSFRGSLTDPFCNEGVIWLRMKSPIEMSQAQIEEYKKYYHDTARPLQAAHDRPVLESK